MVLMPVDLFRILSHRTPATRHIKGELLGNLSDRNGTKGSGRMS